MAESKPSTLNLNVDENIFRFLNDSVSSNLGVDFAVLSRDDPEFAWFIISEFCKGLGRMSTKTSVIKDDELHVSAEMDGQMAASGYFDYEIDNLDTNKIVEPIEVIINILKANKIIRLHTEKQERLPDEIRFMIEPKDEVL